MVDDPAEHYAIERVLALIGGRWKCVILYKLKEGPLRYAELRRAIPEISEKMLVQQLRELEADDIVERTAIPDRPVRVEYAISPRGRTLVPHLEALCDWAKAHTARQAGAERRPKGGGESG